jgi:Protein of unknown function (DUF1573)
MRGRFAAMGAAWVVMLLAGLVLAADQKTDAGPKPSIEIPRMMQDFGDVFERPTYEYSFVVRNRGNADLVIQSVKPGCGCTVAKFDSIIAPGKEGNIKLVLDGGRVHGEFQKTASVKCNDPDHPELTLTIAGHEIPYVKVEPEGTIYLHGRFDEDVEKSVVLSSNEKGVDLKVTGVSSNVDDKITYSYAPGPGKGETTLTIKKNKDMPTSSAYGAITVHTSSDKSPDTVLQVHIMTKGTISVTPSTLNYGVVKFGNKSPGDPVTKSVMILKTEGEFQVKDVVVSNKNFTAKVQSVQAGKQYKIEVTFVPPAQSEANQREIGEMIINTSDEHEPSVRVHLIARAM